MEIRDKIAVVTGAGSGIGAAVASKFMAEGAAGVIIADRDFSAAQRVAKCLGSTAIAVACDVAREEDVEQLAQTSTKTFGRVDFVVSNAGILGPAGGIELSNELWLSMWNIHVMAHVWAARSFLPAMLQRGEGYFVVTASAAGLLNIVESAPYGVTKHAAVGFSEWLRIAYGHRGIRVSCLCPQSVATPMTAHGAGSAGIDGILSAEDVASSLVGTMREERFLSLPHAEVASYVRAKADNYDRWLGGMQKMYGKYIAEHTATAGMIEEEQQ